VEHNVVLGRELAVTASHLWDEDTLEDAQSFLDNALKSTQDAAKKAREWQQANAQPIPRQSGPGQDQVFAVALTIEDVDALTYIYNRQKGSLSDGKFLNAFQDWETAVQNTSFLVNKSGNYVSSQPLKVPAKIMENKKEMACDSCQCSFMNRYGLPAACDIEQNSRFMALKWIPTDASVLEVGARYGSVSCAISQNLDHSGRQVSVDADVRVSSALKRNRANHKCNFHVAQGLLGKKDGQILQNRFGTQASTEVSHDENGLVQMSDGRMASAVGHVPHFTVDDLQKKHNIVFDTANFDCEGCFASVIKDFPELIKQLNLLIVEVHDDAEAAAVGELVYNEGWEVVDLLSRQRVLRRL
jgi:FkbM family methyltransferase